MSARRTHDQVAGSNAGYHWHKRRGEDACADCLAAHAADTKRLRHAAGDPGGRKGAPYVDRRVRVVGEDGLRNTVGVRLHSAACLGACCRRRAG